MRAPIAILALALFASAEALALDVAPAATQTPPPVAT